MRKPEGSKSTLIILLFLGVSSLLKAQDYSDFQKVVHDNVNNVTKSDKLMSDKHFARYFTFWKDRIPEVVHEDGTARAQIVTKATNPRYYALLQEIDRLLKK